MVGGGMASMQALVTFIIVFIVISTIIGIIIAIAKKSKANAKKHEAEQKKDLTLIAAQKAKAKKNRSSLKSVARKQYSAKIKHIFAKYKANPELVSEKEIIILQELGFIAA